MKVSASKSKNLVNIGVIEDYTGDLSIYGLAKLHAAQLAIKEINDGFTLLGGVIGAPGRGIYARYASKTPSIYSKGKEIRFHDKGGDLNNGKVVYVEEDKILIQSGENGILGREVNLISSDGQSDLNVWKNLAGRLVEKEKVDVLFAGFTSTASHKFRP